MQMNKDDVTDVNFVQVKELRCKEFVLIRVTFRERWDLRQVNGLGGKSRSTKNKSETQDGMSNVG